MAKHKDRAVSRTGPERRCRSAGDAGGRRRRPPTPSRPSPAGTASCASTPRRASPRARLARSGRHRAPRPDAPRRAGGPRGGGPADGHRRRGPPRGGGNVGHPSRDPSDGRVVRVRDHPRRDGSWSPGPATARKPGSTPASRRTGPRDLARLADGPRPCSRHLGGMTNDDPVSADLAPARRRLRSRPTVGCRRIGGRDVRVAAHPQLPALLRRPADLAGRQLADAGRPDPAGAAADRQRRRPGAAGRHPVRPAAGARSVGRAGGRPLRQAQAAADRAGRSPCCSRSPWPPWRSWAIRRSTGIFAVALVGGFTVAFDNPARRSFVVEMVPEEDINNAVSLNSALMTSSRVVGPALAGLLVTHRRVRLGLPRRRALATSPCSSPSAMMRTAELRPAPVTPRGKGQVRAGLPLRPQRARLWVPLVMMAVDRRLRLQLPGRVPAVRHRGPRGQRHRLHAALLDRQRRIARRRPGGRPAAVDRRARWWPSPPGLRCAAAGLALAPNMAVACAIGVLIGLGSIAFLTSSTAIVQIAGRPDHAGSGAGPAGHGLPRLHPDRRSDPRLDLRGVRRPHRASPWAARPASWPGLWGMAMVADAPGARSSTPSRPTRAVVEALARAGRGRM